ncbi:i-AAA protease yme1 [Dimargaris verticillata]|uniref:I-AAA protease yme1 n=1 Tax=Dimargaris verticillata TaxID=2761393 RepID=A0A9W8BCH3_9FUNG|nr:i-AAA protease yme1 [Dimargaris verticillata]
MGSIAKLTLLARGAQRPVSTPNVLPTRVLRASYVASGTQSNRALDQLEADADAAPDNVKSQNAVLQELARQGQFSRLVNRIETNDHIDLNEQSMKYYTEALLELYQDEKIPVKLYTQAAKRPRLLRHIRGMVEDHPEADRFAQLPTLSAGQRVQGPYRVVIENQTSPWFRTLRWTLGLVVFATLSLTFMSVIVESAETAKPSRMSGEVEPMKAKSKATFEDVQGCDEAKHELAEVVEFLRNPEKFTELGGRLPKGVLLTGPPGTGKTLLARAVAGEADVPFFFMSGSEFDEMYVGVGARRVRDLFAAARAKAPSIVFIDEIDAIGAKRSHREQAYVKQTLNQLLVDLDGFSPTEGVIFIGATNFPELLDKALVRPGRFDRTIHVPLPDVRGRLAILQLHTRKTPLADNVNLSVLARGTPGMSGAELHNLVNLAAIQASREGSRHVSMESLEYAKDRIIMGAERKSAVITDESKRLTAYHEGGHALVAYHTPGAMPLHKATIIPRGQSLGMVVQLPEMDKSNATRQELEARLAISMGGRVAEEKIFGYDHVTTGASSDIQNATNVARAMVMECGMSDKVGPVAYSSNELADVSVDTKRLIESEVQELIVAAQNRARQVLDTYESQLHCLAQALIERETLTQQEIEQVIQGQPLPPPIPVVAPATSRPSAEPIVLTHGQANSTSTPQTSVPSS